MKMKEKVFCYFHNDDMDGWSSSAVVQRKYPNAEFYGYNYEPIIKLVEGYDKVFMVDCSVSSSDMQYLMENNKEFIWIDHHAKKIWDTYKEIGKDIKGLRDTDSEHSACVLTWVYLYPDEPIPEVLLLIEDMDIWKWKLKDTDAVNIALFNDHRDRKQLNMFMDNWSIAKKVVISNGNLYIKMRDDQVDFMVSNLIQKITFHGLRAGVVNSPIHTSFVGHEMLKRNEDIDIAIIWYAIDDTIRVSLRSKGYVDVSKIAGLYGGGGHKHASGFTLTTSVVLNEFIGDG